MKGIALGFWKPLGNWIVDHRLMPGRSWCDSTVFYSQTLGYDCLLSPCLKWECFLWSQAKTITKALFAKWIYYFIISKLIYFYFVNIKSCYFGVTFTMHPSLWPPRHPTALELVSFALTSHAGLSTSELSCNSLLHFEKAKQPLCSHQDFATVPLCHQNTTKITTPPCNQNSPTILWTSA